MCISGLLSTKTQSFICVKPGVSIRFLSAEDFRIQTGVSLNIIYLRSKVRDLLINF